MATLAGKILAQGTLTTSAATTLYTVPSSTQTYVTSIMLSNVGASTRTVNIYTKKSGGTARRYGEGDKLLAVKGSAGCAVQVLDSPQEMRLAAGDLIAGDASANTDVEYTIMGIEVT